MDIELSPRATQIVDCTRSLLAVGGYNGFSYADIAAEVNISKPTIHHHFPSKADLVQAVVRGYRAEGQIGMAAMERDISDAREQLLAYTGYWEACIFEGTSAFCICAMLAAEMLAIPEAVAIEVRGHFRDLTTWLASVLRRGEAQGVFRLHASADVEAMKLMAAVHGAMLAARAHGDPEMFATIVQSSVQAIERAA